MNYEQYGRSTASAQYFLQLAGYLGIPVIAWNADNSGLERVSITTEIKSKRIYTDLRFYQIRKQLSIYERNFYDVKEFFKLY